MSYILLMTIAGSGLLLGVLLWDLLMRKKITEAFRYGSLIIVMLTFLVPWAWMSGLYGNVFFEMRDETVAVMSGEVKFSDSLFQKGFEFAASPKFRVDLTVTAAWFGIGALVLILRCAYYFCKRRWLTDHAEDCEEAEETADRLKKELGIKAPVRVVRVPGQRFSFTMGILRPVVFLQENCGPGETEIILRHEFTHIARGDLLIKLVMDFVCCLHWINPFVYLLNLVMDRACERACDERAARSMTNAEKETYAHIIVKSSRDFRDSEEKKRKMRKMPYGIYLAANGKQVEERIRVIMNKRQRKVWERVIAAGVLALLIFADSLTALAYPKVNLVQVSPNSTAEDFAKGSLSVYRAPEFNEEEEFMTMPLLYENEVITADGEVYAAVNPSESPTWFCFHAWEDATLRRHLRDTQTGGCTVWLYDCQYCPKCGDTITGNLRQTITYMKCTHDDEY